AEAGARTSEKSRRVVHLGASRPRYFFGALTARRLRPLARRRFSTVRPCLVLIRLRNPCSRLRRILLGWYVRFTAPASTRCEKSAAPKHAGCTVSRNGGARLAGRCRIHLAPEVARLSGISPSGEGEKRARRSDSSETDDDCGGTGGRGPATAAPPPKQSAPRRTHRCERAATARK